MTIPAIESPVAESQLVVLVDGDHILTKKLASALERNRRTIITCNDVESAQIIIERVKPSHVVADIQVSFVTEGLAFLDYMRQHSPETRVILVANDAPDALQLEAAERGAVAFLRKPFAITELDSILNMISCSALSSASETASVVRVSPLDEILVSADLQPFFQPIVALGDEWKPVAYESLARYRADSPLRDPEVLFRYAARKQRLTELECACLRKSLIAARKLPSSALIFVNVHPHALHEGARLCHALVAGFLESRIAPDRVVLEITEHAALRPEPELFHTIERFRDLGLRFAFDDLGVRCSHLPLIDKIRPSFLKVSQHFGTDFEKDPVKIKLVTNLTSIANEFECSLILEGIETASTAHAASRLGVPLGQGFFFGYPADVATFAS